MSNPVTLTFEEAKSLLPKGRNVHTFVQSAMALIGCDHSRASILEMFKKYPPQLAGPSAAAMKHGIVVVEERLFIATDEKALAKFEALLAEREKATDPANLVPAILAARARLGK